MRLRRFAVLAACLALLAGVPAAALPGQDPDWPCPQRLVPEDTFGTFWSGPPPEAADWQADPRLARLVQAVAPRDNDLDAGLAAIDAFARDLSPAERRALLPEAFQGIVEATNRQRGPIIERIEELARRQRSLADVVARVTAELAAIPADATGDAAASRAEIALRRGFLIRSFEETERTMRYACEVPGELDRRLGRFAEALQKPL